MYDFSNVLLRLWQYFFIAPVTRRRLGSGSGEDKYVFNGWWHALNVVVLCVCLAVALCAVMDDLHASKTRRSLRMPNTSATVVTLLQMMLMSMVCAFSVTRSADRHQTLLAIGRQLRHVDAVLGASSSQPMVRYAFVLVVFHAALFTADGFLWYSLSPINWMYCVCYLYLFIELAAMLMYAEIAWSIGFRFQEVNKEIERKLAVFRRTSNAAAGVTCSRPQRSWKFAGNIVAVSTNSYNMNTKEISITKLQELHWSLCDCIKMVNDKFGWYIFLELFLNCVQLIVTPYFMIMDLFFPMVYGSANIKFILTQVIWVLTHVTHLLLIVLPTSYATKKGEKTAVIICKHLSIDIEPDDMKQLEIFVLQLQKYAIEFSACGIVNLHRSTITTIVGTAITYLVILIQFQNTD